MLLNDNVQIEDAFADPHVENAHMKFCEMFFESIPSAVVFTFALIGGNAGLPVATVLSIAVSALVSGFCSSTISADFDADPAKRLIVSEFLDTCPTIPDCKWLFS